MLRDNEQARLVDIICQPIKYGYEECPECDGFGNDNRRLDSVIEICDGCGGDGVVPKNDGTTCSILEEMGVKAPIKDEGVILDESGFSSGAGIV